MAITPTTIQKCLAVFLISLGPIEFAPASLARYPIPPNVLKVRLNACVSAATQPSQLGSYDHAADW